MKVIKKTDMYDLIRLSVWGKCCGYDTYSKIDTSIKLHGIKFFCPDARSLGNDIYEIPKDFNNYM